MPDLIEDFTQEVVTERELKKLRPDWPSALIRDYISFKRNVFITASETGDNGDRLDAIELRLDLIEAALIIINARLTYLEGTMVVTAVNVTASGNTTIICTDSLTVTMALNPLDKDLVKVKQTNGNVTIDGNGNNIDGDSSVIMRRNFTGLDMVYSSTADAWFIV